MTAETGDITALLQRWWEGSKAAENDLFHRVTPDLYRLAHYFVSSERAAHTVRSGDLGEPGVSQAGRRGGSRLAEPESFFRDRRQGDEAIFD